MRRVLALLISASLLVAAGCGMKRYEERLARSLELMKYKKRLDANLMPPAAEGKFTELSIYLRPPRSMALTKVSQLAELPPGLFDLDASFVEPQKQSLHVFARNKQAAKKAPAPKPDEVPVPQAQRNDFTADVLNLLSQVYGVSDEVQPTNLKDETKGPPSGLGAPKKYKRLMFQVAAGESTNDVHVYLFKQDPYDVALIFVFPTAEANKAISKLNLALESFEVGDRARRAFTGTADEDLGEGGEAGSGVAF